MSETPRRLRDFPWPRNDWGEIQPPGWLRHFVSWNMLHWLNERYLLCWSGMVDWKLGGDGPWQVRQSCVFPYDYCGKYDVVYPGEKDRVLRDCNDHEVMLSFPEEPR